MSAKSNGITFSLRTRMTVVMTVLLLLTLATLQYQNSQAQREVQRVLDEQKTAVTTTIDKQNQDIISAANVGLASLGEKDYLYQNLDTLYSKAYDRNVVRHVLIITQDGNIEDATEQSLLKRHVELPPESRSTTSLTSSDEGTPNDPGAFGESDDRSFIRPFAVKGNPVEDIASEASQQSDTYWFGARTTKGKYWIAVVVSTAEVSNAILRSQQQLGDVVGRTATERLQSTLAVFGTALVFMVILVWRFTRPIRQLSSAAQRVARGELDFATDIRRRDEIGQLSATFDAMILQLKENAALEDRLNNAERAAVIGRLTGAIAHEIRNPLNYINLSIDHVRSKFAPADEKGREKFDRLLGSVKEELSRLNRLVNDVLNFGRPANLNFRDVDLRTVLESVIGLVRQQAEEQGVTIETSLPAEPAIADADAEKLKSCFSNIIINALQAMPGGGRLAVSLVESADGTHVTIADTGQGIPEEALERVFEPYYSTKDTGTGLGLAVTKKLVDEHGGRVRVSSKVGEGTTFEVDLPKSRSEAGRRDSNDDVPVAPLERRA